MNKKWLNIFVIVIAVVLIFVVAKDSIIKVSVEKGVQAVTGLKLGISSMRVRIFAGNVGIRGLKLYNPKGYPDAVMLDMPEIYVDYNLKEIIDGTIYLNEMKIDMKEFVVVKNAQGELNLDALKVVKEEKSGEEVPPEEKAASEVPPMQIDLLQLKVGKVIYKDYSVGEKPKVHEYDINLNETFRNIDDPNKLVSIIVVKALMNTTIAKLTNFDIEPLKGMASDTLATAQKAIGSIGETGGKMIEGAAPAAEKTVEGAANTVKGAAEGVTNTIGGIFGGGDKKE